MNNPNEFPLSFVLPIYRAEPFLAEAIESILRQKVEKEIILVIDGSPDNCLQIALDYARRYPFISVVQCANQGVSRARNKGLALARGEYVLFLDPDDLVDDKADFEATYRLAKQVGANVAKGQFVSFMDGAPNQVYKRTPLFSTVNSTTAEICTLNKLLNQLFVINWFTQGACFLYERAFLQRHQLAYREDLHFGEDGIFLTEVLCCEGKAVEVPYMFIDYRMHNNSVVSSPVSAKRLDSGILCTQVLMEKIAHTPDGELKNTLSGILGLFFFFLHRDVKDIRDPALLAQYQHCVTPEMIAYYQRWGIGFVELKAEEK